MVALVISADGSKIESIMSVLLSFKIFSIPNNNFKWFSIHLGNMSFDDDLPQRVIEYGRARKLADIASRLFASSMSLGGSLSTAGKAAISYNEAERIYRRNGYVEEAEKCKRNAIDIIDRLYT